MRRLARVGAAVSTAASLWIGCADALKLGTVPRRVLRVDAPGPNAVVRSPLIVSGAAVGWFYEAEIPIEILDGDGATLGSGYVTAQGDWTRTEPTPFRGVIAFAAPSAPRGTLIFFQSTENGGREERRFPLRFRE